DAKGAVTSLLADHDRLMARDVTAGSAMEHVAERGKVPVVLAGWNAIDAAEITRGGVRGNARVKLSLWEELLTAAAAQAQ
ncbi:MAG TPA: ferredoxin, partial [Mycobacteriales bacterium]|nr:ferredoxin [Mycobacteriales bacterium]